MSKIPESVIQAGCIAYSGKFLYGGGSMGDGIEAAYEVMSIHPDLNSKVAWNGDGLPPVGTVCEYRAEGWPCDQWEVRTVMYVSEYHVITKEEDGTERRVDVKKAQFRPILTAEQIAAEEREAAIAEIMRASGLRARDGCREVAAAIYDAGYRKQAQP